MSTGAPEDPTSLRSYRLIAEIGRGGMASVYLAVARGPAGFNKLVVIKKTRKDLVTEGDVLSMFLDEARLAARMNHPNVVQTYEIGQDGDQYFIAMEYLDGQPYSRVLSRLRGEFPAAMHLRVIADLLTGLHHAHELRDFDGTPLGVVHRDATPQNVFVTYDGSIKVVDFGIAKALDASAQTRTGVVKGKVTYMAPEQVRGEKLDRRADIFAAGVMLWEAIAGRRLWNDLPDLSVVHELMYDRVPRIETAVSGVHPTLVRMCARALAPRRDERYGTALEMCRDIEAYLAEAGLRASARDVGEHIAPAFESERQRVRAVIESQLRDTRWTGVQPRATGRELPSIEMSLGAAQNLTSNPSLSTAMPSMSDPPVSASPLSGQAVSGQLVSGQWVAPPSAPPSAPPLLSAEHHVTSPSGRMPVSVPPLGPISFAPTNSGAAVPLPPAAPTAHGPSRSFVVPVIVAAVASIAVLAIGVKLLVQPGAAPASPVPPSPPAASESAAPKDTAPDAVTLTVRPKPAEARIYLDGVLLATGPFEGKVVRSAKPRVVRVEAEHYLPKQEEIALNADIVLSFDLEREREDAAVAVTTKPSSGLPPSSGPGPGATRPGQRPKREIDSDSPYKK